MSTSDATASAGFERSLFIGTAALFFFLLLLGGGGAPAPVMQAALETISFFWLLFLFWVHLFVRRLPGEAAAPSLFVLAVLLIPALHLVPLPYGIWSGLPGREIAAEAAQLSGLGEVWMPLSLIPEDTRLAGLQMIPAVAIFFGTYALAPDQRLLLARIPVVVAIFSALLAVLQVAAPGTSSLYFFSKAEFTLASGIFANRNFQGDLLLIGILLAAVHVRIARTRSRGEGGGAEPWQRPLVIVSGIAIPLLALMVLATLSRWGALLLGPVLLGAATIASPSRVRKSAAIAGGVILAAGAALIALRPPFVESLLARFGEGKSRLDPWYDMVLAAKIHFPVGSGLGTFDPVYRSVESLQGVGPRYFNHAHNDYFEILIETGLPGMLLVLLFLLFFAARAWFVARQWPPSPYLWIQRAAAMGILLLVVHSVADYPLRTITLQTLFAFFAALLFSHEPVVRRRSGKGR